MTQVERVRRRGLIVVLLAAAVALVAAVGLLIAAWLARNTLGAQAAIRYLARRGIPATIRLTRLDRGGVEGSLVLGPATHPTLVAPRFVAEFAPGPLFGFPRLLRLTLIRPRLEASYDGDRFDFHALQPLVDEASRASKGQGPAPDLDIAGGELGLQTPWGRLAARIDADALGGVLRAADIRLRPAHLATPTAALDAAAGRLFLRATGAGRYLAKGELTVDTITIGQAVAKDFRADFNAELPAVKDLKGPLAGVIHGGLHASARKLSAAGADAENTTIALAVQGEMSGRLAAPKFDGRAEAQARTDRLDFGSIILDRVGLDLDGPHLTLRPGRTLADVHLGLSAHGGRVRIAGQTATLAPAQATLSGRAATSASGPWVDAAASVSGAAGLNPAQARRVAARWAPGAAGEAVQSALAAALVHSTVSAPDMRLTGDRRAWRVRLDRPLQARTSGGATLVLTGAVAGRRAGERPILTGTGALELSGGGLPQARLTIIDAEGAGGRVHAGVDAYVAGDIGPLQGARVQLATAFDAGAGEIRVALRRCADLAVEAVHGATSQPLARAVGAELCPLPSAPVLAANRGGWATALRLHDLAVAAPAAAVDIRQGEAEVRASGRGARLAAKARLDQVVVRDTASSARFAPLRISGTAELADRRATGDFAVAVARAGAPLGRGKVTANLAAASGALSFEAPHLAFAPGGLQPASVLPGLASLGREVSGPASATLALSWRGATITTSTHVRLEGLQLKTAAGVVTGVRTDLTLTGFAPLTSAPGQRLTADRLAALLPLTDLSATYTLGADALTLQHAQADFAGGRLALDHMRAPLSRGASLSGVVRFDDVDLGKVLDTLNLSRALTIQARVAGALPFSYGPNGLRISDGRIAAMGPGRLTLHRKALSGVTATNAGGASDSAMQDFAYQALENLAFSELDARVDSRPQGRLGVVFHVRGRHDPPVAAQARVGLFALLRGHAFDRPIPLPKGTEVNLTLDSSLNLDDLLGAYLARGTAGSPPVQP